MAIAFDATSKAETTVAGSTLSWSHTCTGANRILVVSVVIRGGSAVTVSGITYNSVALTKITAQADGNVIAAEQWRLLAPTTGSALTIAVTLTGSVNIIEGFGVSYTGVDQTTPTGTPAGTTGASTAPSVNVTSAASELVVDVVGAKADDATETLVVGASQTSRGEEGSSDGGTVFVYGGVSEEAGAASVTMSWDMSPNNNNWAIAGSPLKPVSSSVGYLNMSLMGVG